MTVVSAETDLVLGVAGVLVAAGIGVRNDAGTYAADDVAIIVGDFPQDPAQIIALTPYVVSDDSDLNDSILAVQVMLRGTSDLRSVLDRSAAIFNELERLENQTFGSVNVACMWRQTGHLDGKDDSQRWMRSENYYCRVNWPTRYRTD